MSAMVAVSAFVLQAEVEEALLRVEAAVARLYRMFEASLERRARSSARRCARRTQRRSSSPFL